VMEIICILGSNELQASSSGTFARSKYCSDHLLVVRMSNCKCSNTLSQQSGQVRCSPVALFRPMLYRCVCVWLHCGGSTERTGERCFSRFNCAGNSTGTLNGLDFSCPCGAAVTPEQPADWCRTSCDSLSPASGLAKPGLCPSTCYDCEGWSSDPVGMW